MMFASRIGAAAGCLTLGLAWMGAPPPARATTLRRMDLPELVRKADRVVHARAVDSEVYWDSTRPRIYTDTTFEVIEEAKGHGPKRLTVTMLGGRIDPIAMTAEGTPAFEPGEEVILFTSPRPDGKKNLVGFSQGVLRVRVDPDTGERFAVSEVHRGVTYVEGAPGRLTTARPARLRAPVASLLEQIRRIAAGESPGGPRLSDRPERPETGATKRREP